MLNTLHNLGDVFSQNVIAILLYVVVYSPYRSLSACVYGFGCVCVDMYVYVCAHACIHIHVYMTYT